MDKIEDYSRAVEDSASRGLVLITGSPQWTEAVLESLLAPRPPRALIVSDRTLAGLPPTERRRLLGVECTTLVWDLFTRPDVNTLVASSGCLVRGGLLFVVAPSAPAWESHFTCADGSPSLFWQHVLRCFEQWPYRATCSEAAGWQLPVHDFPVLADDPELPTSDQLETMNKVRRVLLGHRRRPLVIRADRGRGKSTLLGLCAAEFLQQAQGDIIITAPRRDAVDAAFAHAADALPGEERPDVKKESLTLGDYRFAYYAPDRLLAEQPPARIVLVDEAAAIPPALLEKIVSRYSRVVFSTTVHGYEGSGRGFDIRFTQSLNSLAPQWQRAELAEPVRWGEGDPLEALINRCFLLDAEADPVTHASAESCRVELLDKLELLSDEALLRSVFGLLVVAHYQTSPSDLQQLLDSLATSVFVLRDGEGRVVGAALVIEEGGLPLEYTDAVLLGERRLRGHLLPQSLVYHAGLNDALSLRCARVSRIAVNQDVRRRGMGLKLLQAIEQFAVDDGLDYVGSSFAADGEVLDFWLGADYLPLRLGVRRDPCSGHHALLVAKPLSDRASELLTPVCERFTRYFPLELRETFAELDPAVASILLKEGGEQSPAGLDERRHVQRFVAGDIAYEHAYPALVRYLVATVGKVPATTDIDLLVEKVLQAKKWKDLAKKFSLKGRKEVEHCLRQAYRLLLSLEG